MTAIPRSANGWPLCAASPMPTRIDERPDDWLGFCERAGIGSLHLAEVVPQPASPGNAG